MARRRLWLDNVLGTAFIFALGAMIFGVSTFKIFDAFDPIGDALGDMELTDIVFSSGIRDVPPVDTNVVIVNIGLLPRSLIGQQINVINSFDPKVVAFDGFFSWPNPFPEEDPFGDEILADAIANTKNMVMVTKLLQTDSIVGTGEEIYDSLERTIPEIRGNAYEAYANLNTGAAYQEDFKACRSFPPKRIVNGKEMIAFGAQIAKVYDPETVEKLLERDNTWETINYRGNVVDWYSEDPDPLRFMTLDYNQVLDTAFTGDMIKDKIVIFGFLGRDFTDTSWDDKFFTPLNHQYAGKTNPDMYGVVIHANIVTMILNTDYLDELGETGGLILAILVCFLNVVFFSWIYRRLPRWYDGLTKLIQVIELLLLGALMIFVFHWFSYKLNLTYTMAAVALAGDSLEVYYGVIKNLFRKESRSQLFRIQTEPK